MDMSLSKLQEMVKGKEAWHAAVHVVTKSQTWLSYWTTTKYCSVLFANFFSYVYFFLLNRLYLRTGTMVYTFSLSFHPSTNINLIIYLNPPLHSETTYLIVGELHMVRHTTANHTAICPEIGHLSIYPSSHPIIVLNQTMDTLLQRTRVITRPLPTAPQWHCSRYPFFPLGFWKNQYLPKNLKIFSVKGQVVNIFIFTGHIFSVTAI